MTCEELLAENQRLRERVHELEQENALLRVQCAPILSEPEPQQYGTRKRKALTEVEKELELQRRVDLSVDYFAVGRMFMPKGSYPNPEKQVINPCAKTVGRQAVKSIDTNAKDVL